MMGMGAMSDAPSDLTFDRDEYETLHAAWSSALADQLIAEVDGDEAAFSVGFYAEQDAYNALVEFVEANSLNYTKFDPRDTRRDEEVDL